MAEGFVVEVGVGGDEGFEGFQFEEGLDSVEGFPASEELEFGERDCDLRLVVCVAEFLGVFLVQFGGQREIGVDLEGEGFAEGEDLELSGPARLNSQVFCSRLTFGKNGISAPHLSRTDLPTSWGFLFRYSPRCSPLETT